MPTADAEIQTGRSGRYLTQLCKHAAAMGSSHGHGPRMHMSSALTSREVRVKAEWNEERGTVYFDPWGTCQLVAESTMLTVRVEAPDQENLRRIQDIVARDLERFGKREGLTVTWRDGTNG